MCVEVFIIVTTGRNNFASVENTLFRAAKSLEYSIYRSILPHQILRAVVGKMWSVNYSWTIMFQFIRSTYRSPSLAACFHQCDFDFMNRLSLHQLLGFWMSGQDYRTAVRKKAELFSLWATMWAAFFLCNRSFKWNSNSEPQVYTRRKEDMPARRSFCPQVPYFLHESHEKWLEILNGFLNPHAPLLNCAVWVLPRFMRTSASPL